MGVADIVPNIEVCRVTCIDNTTFAALRQRRGIRLYLQGIRETAGLSLGWAVLAEPPSQTRYCSAGARNDHTNLDLS